MHEYTRLFAPFTSKESRLSDGCFANKRSLGIGACTHVISGIDFSQLKPNPSLHRWQQMHWCSASKQTAACCRLQDATKSIHIWHVHTVTYIWFCAETTQVSKRCCCRSSCQLDEQLQFYNMLEQILCISTLFRQQVYGMVCLSTRFHTGQHSRFVVIFFCSGPHCLVASCHSLIAL